MQTLKYILPVFVLVFLLVLCFGINGKLGSFIKLSTSNNVTSPPVSNSSTQNNFQLYTRVTSATWPKIKAYAQAGDIFWGKLDEIPKSNRAFTFPNFEVLNSRGTDKELAKYAAINWDSEGKDFNKEYQDAKKIREFVDSYNRRHINDSNFSPLKFIAFFHLNIIKANPDILKYPEVILVGKTSWNASNVKQESSEYLNLIKKYGKVAGILLGNEKAIQASKTKVLNTKDEVIANFEKVFSASPNGLGVNVVGFYYDGDNSSNLIDALKKFRNK